AVSAYRFANRRRRQDSLRLWRRRCGRTSAPRSFLGRLRQVPDLDRAIGADACESGSFQQKDDILDPGVVAFEGLEHGAGGGVPEAGGAVLAGGGEEIAGRVELERGDGALVAAEGADNLAVGEVDVLDIAIGLAGEEGLAIGAEREGGDRLGIGGRLGGGHGW